jgi:hypothetical protein
VDHAPLNYDDRLHNGQVAAVNRKVRATLVDRVTTAAEASLAARAYVTPIDVFQRIGWLDPNSLQRWQRGQVDCLEDVLQVAPTRLAEAMKLIRSWAMKKGLSASPAKHVARTPQRQPLRFIRHGSPDIEANYRTRWLSADLSEKQRELVEEKADRAPELVVVQPLDAGWSCHRCGGTGNLLIMENPGPACLECVGLGDLEFLPTGDALLTRRAKARSARHAVVVRFSRRRHRYERQGVLVEPQVLAEARREIEASRHP